MQSNVEGNQAKIPCAECHRCFKPCDYLRICCLLTDTSAFLIELAQVEWTAKRSSSIKNNLLLVCRHVHFFGKYDS